MSAEREKSPSPGKARTDSEGERPVLAAPASTAPGRRAWRRFRSHTPAMVSGIFLILLLGLALLWPLVAPYAPETTSDAQFQRPSAQHWLGTDVHGRDVGTRVVYGARISLLVGMVGAGVALIIGVAWGAIAGYAGGRLDSVMMRLVDVLYSLPSIIFVMVLLTTFKRIGAGALPLLLLFVGLGAVSWLTMARIVRGQVLSLRTRAFVEASRALGAGHARIIWHHILPNVWGIIIVYLALTVPSVILYESFLSYLGMGIQPPMASWGSLVAEGAGQLNPIRVYWWLILFPGALLVATLLALNFLGDGLRDALDPKGQR